MSFNVNALNRASTAMSRSFSAAGNDMATALERISSGSRINRPSDDFSGFAKVNNLSGETRSFQNRAVQLREHGAVVQQSLDVANQVMSDLYAMRDALDEDGNATDQSAVLGAAIEDAVGLTAHDGTTELISNTLVADLGIVSATGDALSAELSAIAGVAAIDGDSNEAAVDTAISEMETFIQELEGLQAAVQSHASLADTMASNSEAVSSAITEIDEAAEMAKYVDADIRQQASVAMFSQANMSRRNIGMLYR